MTDWCIPRTADLWPAPLLSATRDQILLQWLIWLPQNEMGRRLGGPSVLEQQLLEEFAGRLRAEVAEKLAELPTETVLAPDMALADVMLGYMEEAGLVTEHEFCPFKDTVGRNRCRITGYALPEDSSRLELFTAQFAPEGSDAWIGANALSRLAGRAARFFGYAAAREPASAWA